MSPIEQILAAAKSLSIAGKKPSLALIKTKIGNSVPMPILIQGLQQFKAMDASSVEKIPNLDKLPPATVPDEARSEIEQLKAELAQLTLAYRNLNARLKQLEMKATK